MRANDKYHKNVVHKRLVLQKHLSLKAVPTHISGGSNHCLRRAHANHCHLRLQPLPLTAVLASTNRQTAFFHWSVTHLSLSLP